MVTKGQKANYAPKSSGNTLLVESNPSRFGHLNLFRSNCAELISAAEEMQ